MAATQGLAARLERAGLRMIHPALGLEALGAPPPLPDAFALKGNDQVTHLHI